jgi:hypothetical protein
MTSVYDDIKDIRRKVDRILALLEEVGFVTTRILAEKAGYRLLVTTGPYGSEYVVETPEGKRYSYARLSTARKWFRKFIEELE